MKAFRNLLSLILILGLALCLFACGGECKNHIDTNGDGLCEECGKAAESKENELTLINDDGTLNFVIVLSEGIHADVRFRFVNLANEFKKLGATLEVLEYNDEPAEGKVEVLIGDATGRDEKYIIDPHSLGHEGYAVQLIDDKIVIVGGQNSSLSVAIDYFVDEILGMEDIDELTGVTMSESQNERYVYTDYDITSIKIGDYDIKDFVIAVDTSNLTHLLKANSVRDTIYDESGVYLEVVNLDTNPERAIFIRAAEPDNTAKDSFRVYERNGNLYFECEYNHKFASCMDMVILKHIKLKEGDVVYKGEIYKEDISFITYEDFGAKGDGVTNDFLAIYKAHEEANRTGLTLKINQKATYRISDTDRKRISIKTDVYWGTAKFIIDDKDLEPQKNTDNIIYDRHIFVVQPETDPYKISQDVIDSINAQMKAGTLTVGPDSTKLDVGIGYAAMLLVTNANHRVYIRYGANANSGNTQQEIILIDENGNIDPTTPFLLDYAEVTDITVYSINDTPITIDGGIFTTIAPDYNVATGISDYFDRGIDVRRSNVTIKNITHYVDYHDLPEYTDAGKKEWDPVPYHGFYSFSYGNDIKVENCVMTARRGHGTYDFSAGHCNNLTAYNCTMTNMFMTDPETNKPDESKPSVKYGYWGVMGSSYCKNITFDTCELSRFDAHAGVYNGKILNSKVSLINIIGGGEMLIENTEIFYHRLVELRTDYGATWNGTIKIYDCKFRHNNGSGAYVFTAVWSNHDFGYTTYFPNVEIKNLELTSNPSATIYFIRSENIDDESEQQGIGSSDDIHLNYLKGGVKNENPMVPPEYITIISNPHNVKFVFNKSKFFEGTEVTGFE